MNNRPRRYKIFENNKLNFYNNYICKCTVIYNAFSF